MSQEKKRPLITSKQILRRMSEVGETLKVHWAGMVIGSFALAAPIADEDVRWAVGELMNKDYCADVGGQLQNLACNVDLMLFSLEYMDKMWLMGIGAIGLVGLAISTFSAIKLKVEYELLDNRLERHDFIN